jgi:hypothetical protein
VFGLPKGRFFCGKEVKIMKVSIECCEGISQSRCAKELCPVYSSARRRIEPKYIGTGFGSLQGSADGKNVLTEVRREIAEHRRRDINHGTGNPI